MDATDDSTAVLRIQENFHDFISGRPGDSTVKRLKFDTYNPFDGGLRNTYEADRSMYQGEVIVVKAENTRLQTQLMSLETQLKEANLDHQKEIEKLSRDHQKELSKHLEARNQFLVFAKKENERKQELSEMKQELEKANGSKKLLLALQKEKILLQSELEQTKHDMENAVGGKEQENKTLAQSLQQAQKQITEQEQLQMALRSGNERNSFLEQEVEKYRCQFSTANMKVKELELKVSRFEEDGKVVQMMKTQLNQLKQFESENKTLKEENQYLSAIQKNTHLLTEENNTLHSKLKRLLQQFTEMSKYEVLCEDLQRRLAKWESADLSGSIKSPTQMHQHTAELQREVQQLLEKNGQLQANNHSLEEAYRSSMSQLQGTKAELAFSSAKLQEANDLVRRLRKKLIFVSEENELFKSIVDKYNDHDAELTSKVDVRTCARIQHLERLHEKHQKHITSLQNDLEAATAEAAQLKLKTVQLEQQLLQQNEKEPVALTTTCSADQNIILSLRQKVANLEKQVEELTAQKDEALAKLEHIDIQGGYDRSKTRVLHYQMNPYSLSRNHQTQEMDRLREENARLHAKLNVMKESGGMVEGLSVLVDEKVCPPGTAKELEEIKSQLTSEQLKYQRVIEVFTKKSQEIREVNYKVLGYRIDMPKPGEFRLMSMYAETPNDFFIFKSCNGELQLLANQYSESFQKHVETYLAVGNSLPAFMSSVTLELYGRQTIMQSS